MFVFFSRIGYVFIIKFNSRISFPFHIYMDFIADGNFIPLLRYLMHTLCRPTVGLPDATGAVEPADVFRPHWTRWTFQICRNKLLVLMEPLE